MKKEENHDASRNKSNQPSFRGREGLKRVKATPTNLEGKRGRTRVRAAKPKNDCGPT